MFHLTFGAVYALVAARPRNARRSTDVLLTVMLSVQFVGRFVVFAVIPVSWIRISLVPGALITLAILVLLWRRPATGTPGRDA